MIVELLSLWRNDEERELEDRARHLLEKRSGVDGVELRWLWYVGDSTDGTYCRLEEVAIDLGRRSRVHLVRDATDIAGEDTATRRRRLSVSASRMFCHVHTEAEWIVLHESDLVSSAAIVDQLFAAMAETRGGTEDRHVVAGWPTINLHGRPQFYDVWAYRDLDGRMFAPHPPHCAGWRNGQLLEVGSLGSVWLAPAELVRGRRLLELAVLELCQQWRGEGVRLWADPRIEIVQPVNRWSPAL